MILLLESVFVIENIGFLGVGFQMKQYQLRKNLTSEECTLLHCQIRSQLAREPEYHHIHFR